MRNAAPALEPVARTAMGLVVVLAGCAEVLGIEDWSESPNATGAGGQGSVSVGSGAGASQSASVGSGGHGGSPSASVGSGGMTGSSSSSGTGGQGGGGQDVCGDGQLGGTEQCDDGNASTGDGCDAGCAIEPGYQCTGEPSVCCAPQPEICDGLDNDCDGIPDEGCSCVDGAMQSCYTGPMGTQHVGECKDGTQTCVSGTWGACEGDVLPVPETCDGLDNDCDGAMDEGNPGGGAPCMTGQPGVCGNGTRKCSAGQLTCEPIAQPSPETCDGLDNNCNGIIDENNPGGGAACMTTLPGVCSPGTQQCQGGTLKCLSNVMPSAETCNGLDDNCDGQVDDNNPGGGMVCMTGQQGVCSLGATVCQNGSLYCQQVNMPSPEVCNGLDDDCNSQTDEGNPGGGMDCAVPGQQGLCVAGITACMNGAVICSQLVQPSPEVCDGKDNDCDGQTDEGNPGGTPCQTGLPGVCAAGTLTCINGVLSCQQNVQPSTEICDGKDNDCDGPIDEQLPSNVAVFGEPFAGNVAGWLLDTEWAIGPTLAGPPPMVGNPDPAMDHTPTMDNGVAGVVLGGNYSLTPHPYYYLTSPIINTNLAGPVVLDFWRWLNTDYPPFVTSRIEAYNGSTWMTVWEQPAGFPGITDSAWANLHFDLTPYKNAAMRIRFGFTVAANAYALSGWNIDDIVIRRCQ